MKSRFNAKRIFSMAAMIIAVAVLSTGCASKKRSGADGDTVGAGTLDDAEYTRYGTGASKTGGVGLGTLERVHFGFDSSSVSDQAKDRLENNARTIMANSKMKVMVEGHCDERGSNEYNIALGERRSKAVIDYLVNLGVPRARMEVKSWGEERPLDPRITASAYKINRRAEFVIIEK